MSLEQHYPRSSPSSARTLTAKVCWTRPSVPPSAMKYSGAAVPTEPGRSRQRYPVQLRTTAKCSTGQGTSTAFTALRAPPAASYRQSAPRGLYPERQGCLGLPKVGSSTCNARRLQIQENMSRQDRRGGPAGHRAPLGVAVVIQAQHMCMMMRGVEKQNSSTVTSGGCSANSATTPPPRKRILSLIR
ncbi:GTP cyclohydrolase I [Pseudomonas aeruginosa]